MEFNNNTKEIILKSLPEDIHLVESFIDDISDEFNINNSYFGNILIAVTEAINNAFEHGNQKDLTKSIFVKFEVRPKGFAFIISDEGNGFELDNIPDPTDVNYKAEDNYGRGIYLMKALSDDVKFLDNGSTIELTFNISSINSELALKRINEFKTYSGINIQANTHKF